MPHEVSYPTSETLGIPQGQASSDLMELVLRLSAEKGQLHRELLDVFAKLQLLDLRQQEDALGVAVDRRRAEREMFVLTPGGKWLGGFRAFHWMAWRLPLLVIVAPLLYFPGVPPLGDRVYRWVSHNRFRLMGVSCDSDACAVPDARQPLSRPPHEGAEPSGDRA